jgi:broad specificity phosphatase PhoE
MRLILVRHGKPDEADLSRPHDPPLAPLGWEQAHAVAEALATEDITHIVSSPLQRALDTARPLAERSGLPVQVLPGWAEADRGAVKYRSTETLRAQGREEWQRFLRDPITYLGADTETFKREVIDAVQTTLGLSPEGTVAVFTHGMPINVVLAHVLGLDSLVRFAPGYCSVTRLRARSLQTMSVVSINELGHHRKMPS